MPDARHGAWRSSPLTYGFAQLLELHHETAHVAGRLSEACVLHAESKQPSPPLIPTRYNGQPISNTRLIYNKNTDKQRKNNHCAWRGFHSNNCLGAARCGF